MKHSTILMAALLSLAPAAAFAHPHIFVEARLEVVAGKDGSVEELRNVWRFDEVFSSSVVMDFDKNTDLKLEPNELAEVGKNRGLSLQLRQYHRRRRVLCRRRVAACQFCRCPACRRELRKGRARRADFDKAVLTAAKFSFANLSRADLSGATFETTPMFDRAFMFLTRIEGLDLSAATGLEQAQIDLACGDASTKLPAGLSAPTTWPCPAEHQ